MITVLNDQRDTPRLRALVERKKLVRWWGRKTFVTPRLVSAVFGDGKRLIALAPMMYRPNHFIVRIDSGWNLDNQASDCELLIDHIDDIYETIEEEYYDWPWWKSYGLKPGRDYGEEDSARVCFEDGSTWWEEEWPSVRS